jgi:formylglycine-generating enzyme required for sulfatase activity
VYHFALWISLVIAAAPQGVSVAAEPEAGTAIVHPGDGAVMVYVPAGEFVMVMDAGDAKAYAASLGYDDYRKIAADEWFPRRRVHLGGFFVDKHEVTNQRWAKFIASGVYTRAPDAPETKPAEKTPGEWDLHPVVNVYWDEARRYANWAGKSLPTEAQWEKSARGTDGRVYPWGSELPDETRGVFVNMQTNEPAQACAVGSKPKGASPYGCLDMAGNVYEWTSEWMEPYPNNPQVNAAGPWGHQFGVLRGGSFYHANHAYACAKRMGFKPGETYFHVGFRTVWEPPAGYFESERFKNDRARVAEREAEMETKRPSGASRPAEGSQ